MLQSLRLWLPLGCSVLLALGCRDRGSSDQETRALPSPEPPASATATTAHEEPPPPKKRPADEVGREVARPKRAADEAEPASEAPSQPATTPSSAVTPSSAAPSASAAPVAAPAAACVARCQTALQGCLAQPVDGGVPGFANLDLCKKAFEACQSACK
jgi:hypothetical protein